MDTQLVLAATVQAHSRVVAIVSAPCPPAAVNPEGEPFASYWHLLVLGLVRPEDEVSVEVHADTPIAHTITVASMYEWMHRRLIATIAQCIPLASHKRASGWHHTKRFTVIAGQDSNRPAVRS